MQIALAAAGFYDRNIEYNKNKINYEDAIIFSYIKGLLEGFNYNNMIKEIVVDEAQDYTLLQYKILSKIFKKSSFSIKQNI